MKLSANDVERISKEALQGSQLKKGVQLNDI